MVLHANKLKSYQKDEKTLSWIFNVATAKDMSALGTAFAQVIKGVRSAGVRIGLSANPAMGKSTFAKGILSSTPLELAIEELDYGQGLWRIKGGTWLRHYDAALNLDHICPKSYTSGDTSPYGSRLSDIVEHPEFDRNDQLFDCLILIEKADNLSGDRCVTIMPTRKLANSARFHGFLEEAKPYLQGMTP